MIDWLIVYNNKNESYTLSVITCENVIIKIS